ncbi:MAG: hypothetical protein H6753_00565 [Candidatus Omnitrophica bacterium]|nr:hypothetical protein [Candidatus Omnitrophota bacterium]
MNKERLFYTLGMFTSIKSRLGQASLEYVAVAVFVMAAILIGGPYVVRSINSNFKVLEEGVIDSEREKITEGHANINLPVCDCTDLVDVGCGDGVTAVNGTVCMPNQKVFRRTCGPQGCEAQMLQMHVFDRMEECRNDPTNTCCYPATDGFCGNNPAASGTCRSSDGSLRDRLSVCGSPSPITRVTACQSDPANCLSACQAKSPNATWCPFAQTTFLPGPSWPVTYRDTGGCSSSANYCEAQCNSGYTAIAGGCLDHCGDSICQYNLGEYPCDACGDCGDLPVISGLGCGVLGERWSLGPSTNPSGEITNCSNCPTGTCWLSPNLGQGDWVAYCIIPPGYSGPNSCSWSSKGIAYGTAYCFGSHVFATYFAIKSACATTCP